MSDTHSHKTIEDLVEGCCQNDRLCQEQLYRQFFPVVMGMCMRYAKDKDKALEIVNLGFLQVFQKLHTFSFKGSLEGWIKKVVFHVLADYFRKRGRETPLIPLDHLLKAEEGRAPLQKMYVEDLMMLVEELPVSSQDVFRLYAVEGYNHREIAEMLGISEGTSKWHLSNARKKLKQLIRKNFGLQYYVG